MSKTKKVLTEKGPELLEKLVCDILECKFGMDCCTGEGGKEGQFKISFSKPAPADPAEGDYWFTTDTGKVYIYNGVTWDVVSSYIINGTNAVDVSILSGINKLNFATTEGKVEVARVPVDDDVTQFMVLQEPAPGIYQSIFGHTNGDADDYTMLVVQNDRVLMQATADKTDQIAMVVATDNNASLQFTDVSGGGVNNTTITAGDGIVTITSPVVLIDTPDLRIDTVPTTAVETPKYELGVDNSGNVLKKEILSALDVSTTGVLPKYFNPLVVVGNTTVAGADITLTLPTTASIMGNEYIIMNDVASAHNVIVAASGPGTSINGTAGATLPITPGKATLFRPYNVEKWVCIFI